MPNAKLWMPLYIGDYLGDTQRLTTEQHGAYLLLMMDYWRNGPPPDDDEVLRQIALLDKTRWKRHRPAIQRFFQIEKGCWIHKRIERERVTASDNSERRSAKASAAASARWNAPSNATGMPQAKHRASPSPSPSPPKDKSLDSNPNPFAGEAWDGWLESRKKKPTARAIKLAIADLAALQARGHPPDEVLNQSTKNGWTGLFPLKGDHNGYGNGADKRDGLAKAIDRHLGPDGASGAAGRRDAGDGEGDRRLPAPGAPAVQ